MKYGFIGGGKIAEAIISGMNKAGVCKPELIFVYDTNAERLEYMKRAYSVNVLESAAAVAAKCEMVFLTVKPNILDTVLAEIKLGMIVSKPFLVSIVAGATIKSIEKKLEYKGPVARVMPNYNAMICESMSLVCSNSEVSESYMNMLNECVNAIGKAFFTTEDKMPVMTALCGCAPAFAYLFIDSLAKAAQKQGVDKKTALKLASRTVMGSAKMIEETVDKNHPWEHIDAVCSPGGMTIEGICALEANGFQAAVADAFEAAMYKDSSLRSE